MSTPSNQRLGTAELLYWRAQHMGLQPSWVVPKGLFVISIAGQERYINFACSPLNSHTSASIARDKYVTRLVLERHKLQNIPFARPRTQGEAENFLCEHGKIVAKPVRGAGGRDIHIITDTTQIHALNITEYILEKYILGKELRYLVLNGDVIGVHRSEYGTSVAETRPLQRISYPQDDWDETLVSLSVQIASIVGLKFAAVDYLVDPAGCAHILEVNTNPGLKWFHAPTFGPPVDVASLFLEAIIGVPPAQDATENEIPLGVRPLSAYS